VQDCILRIPIEIKGVPTVVAGRFGITLSRITRIATRLYPAPSFIEDMIERIDHLPMQFLS
jgi:hypothetical protein